MYKDKEKQRESNKGSAKHYRKGMAEGVTIPTHPDGTRIYVIPPKGRRSNKC